MKVTVAPAGTVSIAGEKPVSVYTTVGMTEFSSVVVAVSVEVGLAGVFESKYHTPPATITRMMRGINVFIEEINLGKPIYNNMIYVYMMKLCYAP